MASLVNDHGYTMADKALIVNSQPFEVDDDSDGGDSSIATTAIRDCSNRIENTFNDLQHSDKTNGWDFSINEHSYSSR